MAQTQHASRRGLEDYVGVHVRVEKFRADHPSAHLVTAIIKDDPLTIRCEVYLDGNTSSIPNSTGMADAAGGMGNRGRSALEMTETAAVGRALAFLGYEVKEGIASREEMERAGAPQPLSAVPVKQPAEAPLPNETAVKRELRAKGMAAMGLVKHEGGVYKVTTPSARGKQVTYEVSRDAAGKVRCTCLDFDAQSKSGADFRCEHILAVKHSLASKPQAAGIDIEAERTAKIAKLRAMFGERKYTDTDVDEYLRKNCGGKSLDALSLKELAELCDAEELS